MENVHKWFDYPRTRAHPGCEVSCHGTCIISSSTIRRGQPDSGESCIVLQSRLTRSLVDKFLQCSVVACNTRISCCWGRTLQMRPRTGVCEPLMPDVVAPKVHQNNHSYVISVDLPSDSLRENLARWAVTWRILKKTQNCQNWGVGACSSMGACSGQYGTCQVQWNPHYSKPLKCGHLVLTDVLLQYGLHSH